MAPQFAHQARPLQQSEEAPDLAEPVVRVSGGKASNAGRPRLSMRLMIALTLLKNSFDLSDEELVSRFAENVYWQHFAGFEYFDPRPLCDATQIGRFRAALGEAGLEELLSATIHTAVDVGAIKKSEFKRVIVDTTVQEKAIAHPVDSRLLEIARRKVVAAAKRCGMALKQTFAAVGKTLQRQAGGYAHVKQFKCLRRVVKRQRTILGIVIRETRRKMSSSADNALALTSLNISYGWNAPSAFAPSSARTKTNSTRCTHRRLSASARQGQKALRIRRQSKCGGDPQTRLAVGARSFTGNPYDGHTLSAQMEQSTILPQDLKVAPRQVVADLGFRGKEVDRANPDLEIIHRGRIKTMTKKQRRWLKRRQAVEPAIGHLKSDNRMQRCWLQGVTGDALHALCCAVGYNLRC